MTSIPVCPTCEKSVSYSPRELAGINRGKHPKWIQYQCLSCNTVWREPTED